MTVKISRTPTTLTLLLPRPKKTKDGKRYTHLELVYSQGVWGTQVPHWEGHYCKVNKAGKVYGHRPVRIKPELAQKWGNEAMQVLYASEDWRKEMGSWPTRMPSSPTIR